jgi:hypothetical protein
MITAPAQIKTLKQVADPEGMLLRIYFFLKDCDKEDADRIEMIIEYNCLVRLINNADPFKHYRQIIR